MLDKVRKAPLTMLNPDAVFKRYSIYLLKVNSQIHQEIWVDFKRNHLPDNVITV